MKKVSLVLVLLVCILVSAFAEKKTVTGSFLMFDQSFYQDYEYDDGYFFNDPTQYNHDLARLTLGLALAASRKTTEPLAQDVDLIDFFGNMGFENIDSRTYRTEPTADSIGYGLAMWFFVPVLTIAKMIPGTLVFFVILVYACKGCRQGSGNWKNFWFITGSLALYEVLESLLVGAFTIPKALVLLAVYALYLALSYVVLWKGKKA